MGVGGEVSPVVLVVARCDGGVLDKFLLAGSTGCYGNMKVKMV